MIFIPINDNFYTYECGDCAPTKITPQLFTRIVKIRSEHTAKGLSPAGGQTVTDYFINQIDMTDTNAFTLGLIEYAQWHEVMDQLT